MSKDEYIKVSLLDVIRAYGLAKNSNDDPEVVQKLVDIFTDEKNIDTVELSVDSLEARCILKHCKTVELKSYITLESLGLALNKLIIGKNNKELLKRIEKYYRTFLDNMTHEEDNTELKQEIIVDNEAFSLIRQHSTYADYVKEITGKKAKRKVLTNKQEPASVLQGKPILE